MNKKQEENLLITEFKKRRSDKQPIPSGSRLNAHHDLTNVPLVKKPNIAGKIDYTNKNHTPDDYDSLEPLFPQDADEFAKSSDTLYTVVKQNRNATTEVPDRMPTAGLPFYPIDEHFMIGEMETKRNLYLVFAHAYNKLIDRIEQLEKKLK